MVSIEQIKKKNGCDIAKSFFSRQKNKENIKRDFVWSKSLCEKPFSIKN
jgi:hypothetical protein